MHAKERFQPYREAGLQYIKAQKLSGKDPCVALSPGNPEWIEWRRWFIDRFGQVPWEIVAVERDEMKTATFPARSPMLFEHVMDRPSRPRD